MLSCRLLNIKLHELLNVKLRRLLNVKLHGLLNVELCVRCLLHVKLRGMLNEIPTWENSIKAGLATEAGVFDLMPDTDNVLELVLIHSLIRMDIRDLGLKKCHSLLLICTFFICNRTYTVSDTRCIDQLAFKSL